MYTPDNTPTFHFYKIVDPSQFNAQRLISIGRNIINYVDEDICSFLASFTLHAEGNGEYILTEAAITKLKGAPSELLTSLVRYIDFSELSADVQKKNIITLARFTARRFDAVSLIAHGKKLLESTDCFDEKRHNEVLTKKEATISRLGGNGIVGSQAFSGLMNAGCNAQNAYLNNKETKQQPITRKLEQLGLPALG